MDGRSRIDGVYTRSYDVELSATSKAYADICGISTAHGARVVSIDVVQDVVASSQAQFYVVCGEVVVAHSRPNSVCLSRQRAIMKQRG